MEETAVTSVAHAIQLAVAPVFLLAGIGAILSVMNHRLSRVIDRVRTLEAREADNLDDDKKEMRGLARRASLAITAITFCSITAICVSAVIATLFLGVIFKFDTSIVVSVIFITAMFSLFIGLTIFLREIFIAMGNLSIRKHMYR